MWEYVDLHLACFLPSDPRAFAPVECIAQRPPPPSLSVSCRWVRQRESEEAGGGALSGTRIVPGARSGDG